MATGFTYISDGGRVVEIVINRRELAALVEHGYIRVSADSQMEGPLRALVIEVSSQERLPDQPRAGTSSMQGPSDARRSALEVAKRSRERV